MAEAPGQVVIVGAGQAGVELAINLRQRQFAGGITLFGDEDEWPYQRPPLSKEFIKTGGDVKTLTLRPMEYYAKHEIDLRLGMRVERIDRERRLVTAADGSVLPYDHLVLATGTSNRQLPVEGLDHPDVMELRTLGHARRLIASLPRLRHVAIVGGGFIGLEIASLLREKEIEVTVIEAADRLMGRVVSPAMSSWFRSFHEAHGVRFHFGTLADSAVHSREGSVVTLRNGEVIHADAVLLAAGVVPNDGLARDCGLAVRNGIVVDQWLSTSDPAISAMGDCAAHPSRFAEGLVRLESVQNAVDQAKTIARRLTGDRQPYDSLPWFWSIQGSARLQIAGIPAAGAKEVMRGPPESGRFSIFQYAGDRLFAVQTVNAPGEHLLMRKLLSAGISVPPDLAAEETSDLKGLLAGVAA